jgi:hypothetical protein
VTPGAAQAAAPADGPDSEHDAEAEYGVDDDRRI